MPVSNKSAAYYISEMLTLFINSLLLKHYDLKQFFRYTTHEHIEVARNEVMAIKDSDQTVPSRNVPEVFECEQQ
jgi:hypothetical protein